MKPKRVALKVWIEQEALEALRAKAKADNRSVSNYVLHHVILPAIKPGK